MELLMAGVPGGYWFALHFETGKPVSENGQACWSSKAEAVKWITDHKGNPNHWFFEVLPWDGIPRTWQSFAATLRFTESKELYWRANSDPDVRLHIPNDPLASGNTNA